MPTLDEIMFVKEELKKVSADFMNNPG